MRAQGSVALIATVTGLALLAGLLSTGSPTALSLEANSITAPDAAGIVGRYTSLELDASGNPVISHWDFANRDLKIVHCNDANCSGGDESITTPDTAGDVGSYTSLALDISGYPVVSYWDATSEHVKLLHCNDANCSGDDESTLAVAVAGAPAQFTQLMTSLVLDGDGNPVVSFHNGNGADLNVLHCNDHNCSGGNESITPPDTGGSVGYDSSLVLDGAGNPVVTYRDATNSGLKVLHCNDANCSGGNESITTSDTAGAAGAFASIALGGSGNPVVTYFDAANGNLKLLHCGNVNCTAGNTITAVDTKGNVGAFTSLLIDGAGNPAVSYYDYNRGELKVLRCGNPNCTAGNKMSVADVGTDSIDAGQFTSLELDSAGRPVVSYLDNWDSDLKVLHCSDAICSGGTNSVTAPDTLGGVGTHSSLALDAAGKPIVSYYDGSNADLKVMHCNDPNCAGGDESITSPDVLFSVGRYTSIALDTAGNPVISYYFENDGDLRILHCNDANCAGGDESVTTPDTAGLTGQRTSLALDAGGNPVVSYVTGGSSGVKVLHCNDANCAGGDDSITTVDNGAVPVATSLALDAAGRPVIGYKDDATGDLKLAHCNDSNCMGNDESIASPDTAGDVGDDASLALDLSGFPVVSYYDLTNGDLKVLHCNDVDCTGGGESTTSPDTAGLVALSTSLELDASGFPVVSYYDESNGDLKLLRCNDANCAGGGERITVVDAAGNVGQDSSLALDTAGNPVVSYADITNFDLRVFHCGDPDCNPDTDQDGCTDARELQPPQNVIAGGGRNPKSFWDFFDVPTGGALTRDRSISAPDIFAVISRFNASGNSGIDPLSMPPPAPGYHTAYDRGSSAGPSPWNLTAANGSIASTDIFAVIGQFNHSCA